MQIQASGLTLFDFLADPQQSESLLQDVAKSQKQHIGDDIDTLQDSLKGGRIDEALERLQSGEGGVNLQTLDNMIAFNMRPIANDLQQMASRLGIKQPVELKQVEDKWLVDGAGKNDRALQQLQNYIERNSALTDKLNKLNTLSEFYELGQTQEYARQLKDADVAEADVINYLVDSRKFIFELDNFQISEHGVTLASREQSLKLFEQAKTKFGLANE